MATDDRRAPRWSIIKRTGTPYTLTITPTDPVTSLPVIATAVSAPVFVSGQSAGSLAASVDPLTGVVTVALTSAQSAALGQITGVWELRATIAGESQQWLTGPIRLTAIGSPRDSRPLETLDLSVGGTVTINLSIGGGGAPGPTPVAIARITDPVKSSIYVFGNATPTPVSGGAASKALGTFLAGPACQSCSYSGNRITYIATPPTRALIVATADVSGSNNETYQLEIRKNGNPIAGAASLIRHGNQIAHGSLTGQVDLTTGDYVELWIANLTSNNSPTVVDATMALIN